MERAIDFHPHISAVLNITPDHMDRHKTLENYIAMKERVFTKQTKDDFCILNWCDETTRKMADKTQARVFFFSSGEKIEEGIYLENDDIDKVQKLIDKIQYSDAYLKESITNKLNQMLQNY